MGIVKPPWVQDEWFKQCPFNYCDHFGDREKLALVCKVCREEAEYNARCEAEEVDPNDPKIVFREVSRNFQKAIKLLHKDAKRMEIGLDNLPDLPPRDKIDPRTRRIFKIAEKYGNQTHKLINIIGRHAYEINTEALLRTVDALSHSRFYVQVKIHRALASAYEELRDPDDDLYDSKTSAFFAYLAIERNIRAVLALVKKIKSRELKEILLEYADVSVELANVIQKGFFPLDDLVYKEFGAEEY